MPSGRTHDRITLWLFPAIIGIAAGCTRSFILTTIISVTYLIGGLMLGPDLDIHSVQYKRWGPLRWIWLPYQKAIPHRSHLSHGPVVGTALRVLYLSVWLALFALISIEVVNAIWDIQITWQVLRQPFRNLLRKYLIEWVAVLIGLEAGAISHSISDYVGSYLVQQRSRKKNKRKKRRKKKRSS